jgi:hypothetical protein
LESPVYLKNQCLTTSYFSILLIEIISLLERAG